MQYVVLNLSHDKQVTWAPSSTTNNYIVYAQYLHCAEVKGHYRHVYKEPVFICMPSMNT